MDYLEIWWYAQLGAECLPLTLGGRILPEGRSGQSLSDHFVCSIVSIQCFSSHVRRHRFQIFCCGKKVLNLQVKCDTGRCVILYMSSASLLSFPVVLSMDVCVCV